MEYLGKEDVNIDIEDLENTLNILEEGIETLDIMDVGEYNYVDSEETEILPEKIIEYYDEDYNIIYIDDIIKKKLRREKQKLLPNLEKKLTKLLELVKTPQTQIMREKTLNMIRETREEIASIKNGTKIKDYKNQVDNLLEEYKKYSGKVRTIFFDLNDKGACTLDQDKEIDDKTRQRLILIEKYLKIARKYIEIDIIKNVSKKEKCPGCGEIIEYTIICDYGNQICPICKTECNNIINTKTSKDSSRINISNSVDDESMANFLRAFDRYQGNQTERPDPILYEKLDEYFIQNDKLSGDEVRKLSLNSRGRRGETNHKMLKTALSQIGYSDYYEDINLIGHIYWGWELPDLNHLRSRIIDKYIKTQKVFHQIPPEIRARNSSLGTQYRLWRHLQLEGHECYREEFKIAENQDSIRIHNNLWKMMCEGTKDPNIYYIP